MSEDIAKTMAERIRNAAASGFPAPAAPSDKSGAINDRQAYVLTASEQFGRHYGVNLADVTALFVPRNDMIFTAAESGVPVEDFVKTLGSQFAFDSVVGKDRDFAGWVAGENAVKLALAEFASSDDEWTFTDGFAVSESDGGALVIGPAFDETISSWQFSAFTAACDKDTFVAMSRADKAATPSEERVYGDIDDCIGRVYATQAAPAAPRM